MTQHLNHKLTTQDENKAIRDSIKTVTHLVTQNEPLPEPERSQYLAGANGGFDLIYSSYVMHHIEDIQGTIDTLAQKLVKKDGWVIIIDFQGPHHHHHHHHEGDGEHEKHGEHSSEGHGHGHGHNHNHGHSHGDISNSLFVDENGNPLDYVAHKQGFTSEGLTEVFKKAGLVDVSARTAFGMSRELFGKKIWADVLVIKGRRA
ncbi:hypothetical protein BX616_002324 [Lobosporangium transversale]|nr:hypothetical protein BX616_002324 [Lobosporangium transversale]